MSPLLSRSLPSRSLEPSVEKWTLLIHDSPEAASSFNAASSGTTSSPEPASLDDNESIVIPFPDDDNVSAPQLQPVQSYPAQPQPRTIPVEKWTLLIHDSPEECMGCCNAGEGKVTKQRSTGLQLDLPVLDPAQ